MGSLAGFPKFARFIVEFQEAAGRVKSDIDAIAVVSSGDSSGQSRLEVVIGGQNRN
jgi:hypothetical protein